MEKTNSWVIMQIFTLSDIFSYNINQTKGFKSIRIRYNLVRVLLLYFNVSFYGSVCTYKSNV